MASPLEEVEHVVKTAVERADTLFFQYKRTAHLLPYILVIYPI